MGATSQKLLSSESKNTHIDDNENQECNWDYFVKKERLADVHSFTSLRNGKFIAITRKQKLTIYNAQTGLQIAQSIHLSQERPHHEEQIISSHTQQYIISEGTDYQVRIWDPKSKKLIRHPQLKEAKKSQHAQMICYASLHGSKLEIWSIDLGYKLLQQEGSVNAADFCNNNQVITAKTFESKISIINLCTQKSIHYQMNDYQQVFSLACSRIGNTCALGSNKNTIKIVNLRPYKLIFTLKKNLGNVECLRFSPKGDILISAQNDQLQQWKIVQRSCQQLKEEVNRVNSIKFSGDGKFVACQDRVYSLLFQSVLQQD